MTTPGQDARSAYSRHVRARVSDFARDKTPWQRRLWNVGSMYALEELHEAAT